MNWNIFQNKVPESRNFYVTPNPNLNLSGTLSGLIFETLLGGPGTFEQVFPIPPKSVSLTSPSKTRLIFLLKVC